MTKKTKKSNLKLILSTCAIFALLQSTATAKQGVYIVEPFSCDVALADFKELSSNLLEDNPNFVQEQLELSLKLTLEELAEHTECEGEK